MQYQVPQFIEVEDKIFGPLTFKQFVYLIGGGGICYISYRFLPLIVAILIIAPVIALSTALAFYQVNRKPFIEVMISAIKFFFTNKLYIWKKSENVKQNKTDPSTLIPKLYVPKLSESKLRDLTWSLDINESVSKKEENEENAIKLKSIMGRNFIDNEL